MLALDDTPAWFDRGVAIKASLDRIAKIVAGVTAWRTEKLGVVR